MKEQILRQMIRESIKKMISEATIKEAEQTVKSEAISRLADFFRVPAQTLSKFNFDGKDNIKALSAALGSMSDQGTKMYYDMAIELAKKELGVEESTEPKVDESLKTKIKEAGGRRFAKTESIRQHNASKIKEANKKK